MPNAIYNWKIVETTTVPKYELHLTPELTLHVFKVDKDFYSAWVTEKTAKDETKTVWQTAKYRAVTLELAKETAVDNLTRDMINRLRLSRLIINGLQNVNLAIQKG